MSTEFLRDGMFVYIKKDGIIGGKANKNMDDAKKYADRVDRGLAQIEPLSETAIKNISLNRNRD